MKFKNADSAIGKAGSLIEAQRKAQLWADENIKQCKFTCNGSMQLFVTLKGFDFRFCVQCPLQSKKCKRGAEFCKRAESEALANIPDSVPVRFRNELSTATESAALNGIQRWNSRGVCYIFGPTGTGKSFCAAWWVYQQMLGRFRANWDNPAKWPMLKKFNLDWVSAVQITMEKTVMYRVISSHLLVLDDLGAEVNAAQAKSMISEVLSERYNRLSPTIITSTLSPSELARRYGERVYERILNGGHCIDTGTYNNRLDAEYRRAGLMA